MQNNRHPFTFFVITSIGNSLLIVNTLSMTNTVITVPRENNAQRNKVHKLLFSVFFCTSLS